MAELDLFNAMAEIAGVFVSFGALISVTRRDVIETAQLGQIRAVVTIGWDGLAGEEEDNKTYPPVKISNAARCFVSSRSLSPFRLSTRRSTQEANLVFRQILLPPGGLR